jgi:hypothetical protein
MRPPLATPAGYGRALLEAIEVLARRLHVPRLLLCSTDDAKTKATWQRLGFEFTQPGDLERFGVQGRDLLHMDNTVQVRAWAPREGCWGRREARCCCCTCGGDSAAALARSATCIKQPPHLAARRAFPQMHKSVSEAQPWQPLLLRHGSFQQRLYYLPGAAGAAAGVGSGSLTNGFYALTGPAMLAAGGKPPKKRPAAKRKR